MACQPVESTSPFKVLVSDVNLHLYSAELLAATDASVRSALMAQLLEYGKDELVVRLLLLCVVCCASGFGYAFSTHFVMLWLAIK